MVYVDELMDCASFSPPPCFKGRSCHMWADTIPELLAMADRIGLKYEWIDNNRRGDFPHFDLTRRRRRAAIMAGAKKCLLRDYLRARRAAKESSGS